MTEDKGEIWKTYEFVRSDNSFLADLSSALFREPEADWRRVSSYLHSKLYENGVRIDFGNMLIILSNYSTPEVAHLLLMTYDENDYFDGGSSSYTYRLKNCHFYGLIEFDEDKFIYYSTYKEPVKIVLQIDYKYSTQYFPFKFHYAYAEEIPSGNITTGNSTCSNYFNDRFVVYPDMSTLTDTQNVASTVEEMVTNNQLSMSESDVHNCFMTFDEASASGLFLKMYNEAPKSINNMYGDMTDFCGLIQFPFNGVQKYIYIDFLEYDSANNKAIVETGSFTSKIKNRFEVDTTILYEDGVFKGISLASFVAGFSPRLDITVGGSAIVMYIVKDFPIANTVAVTDPRQLIYKQDSRLYLASASSTLYIPGYKDYSSVEFSEKVSISYDTAFGYYESVSEDNTNYDIVYAFSNTSAVLRYNTASTTDTPRVEEYDLGISAGKKSSSDTAKNCFVTYVNGTEYKILEINDNKLYFTDTEKYPLMDKFNPMLDKGGHLKLLSDPVLASDATTTDYFPVVLGEPSYTLKEYPVYVGDCSTGVIGKKFSKSKDQYLIELELYNIDAYDNVTYFDSVALGEVRYMEILVDFTEGKVTCYYNNNNNHNSEITKNIKSYNARESTLTTEGGDTFGVDGSKLYYTRGNDDLIPPNASFSVDSATGKKYLAAKVTSNLGFECEILWDSYRLFESDVCSSWFRSVMALSDGNDYDTAFKDRVFNKGTAPDTFVFLQRDSVNTSGSTGTTWNCYFAYVPGQNVVESMQGEILRVSFKIVGNFYCTLGKVYYNDLKYKDGYLVFGSAIGKRIGFPGDDFTYKAICMLSDTGNTFPSAVVSDMPIRDFAASIMNRNHVTLCEDDSNGKSGLYSELERVSPENKILLKMYDNTPEKIYNFTEYYGSFRGCIKVSSNKYFYIDVTSSTKDGNSIELNVDIGAYPSKIHNQCLITMSNGTVPGEHTDYGGYTITGGYTSGISNSIETDDCSIMCYMVKDKSVTCKTDIDARQSIISDTSGLYFDRIYRSSDGESVIPDYDKYSNIPTGKALSTTDPFVYYVNGVSYTFSPNSTMECKMQYISENDWCIESQIQNVDQTLHFTESAIYFRDYYTLLEHFNLNTNGELQYTLINEKYQESVLHGEDTTDVYYFPKVFDHVMGTLRKFDKYVGSCSKDHFRIPLDSLKECVLHVDTAVGRRSYKMIAHNPHFLPKEADAKSTPLSDFFVVDTLGKYPILVELEMTNIDAVDEDTVYFNYDARYDEDFYMQLLIDFAEGEVTFIYTSSPNDFTIVNGFSYTIDGSTVTLEKDEDNDKLILYFTSEDGGYFSWIRDALADIPPNIKYTTVEDPGIPDKVIPFSVVAVLEPRMSEIMVYTNRCYGQYTSSQLEDLYCRIRTMFSNGYSEITQSGSGYSKNEVDPDDVLEDTSNYNTILVVYSVGERTFIVRYKVEDSKIKVLTTYNSSMEVISTVNLERELQIEKDDISTSIKLDIDVAIDKAYSYSLSMVYNDYWYNHSEGSCDLHALYIGKTV